MISTFKLKSGAVDRIGEMAKRRACSYSPESCSQARTFTKCDRLSRLDRRVGPVHLTKGHLHVIPDLIGSGSVSSCFFFLTGIVNSVKNS